MSWLVYKQSLILLASSKSPFKPWLCSLPFNFIVSDTSSKDTWWIEFNDVKMELLPSIGVEVSWSENARSH